MRTKEFCLECGLSFGLVDRCETAPSTCTGCAGRMRMSGFGECDQCHRAILIGDRIHLEWSKLCRKCAAKREAESNGIYQCQTIAR